MCNSLVKSFLFVLLAASASASEKTAKRGVPEFNFEGFHGGFNNIPSVPHELAFGFGGIQAAGPWVAPASIDFAKAAAYIPQGLTIQKHIPYQSPISPVEIATAVAAAKEASARVIYAQQRVQAAKEAVLEQQRIASIKEAQAKLALQRSEAAAAVQRQASSAAATSVVLAQQRLAEAKAMVADQQRIAAEKESIAAIAIQKSASAAAAEIRRTEDTAAKIAALQRSEASAAIQHVTAAKDATLAATAAAVSAASNAQPVHTAPAHYISSKPAPEYQSWK